MLRRRPLAVALHVLAAGSTLAQDPPTPRVVTDLRYFEGEGASDVHRLDLHLPAEERPPLVMFVHGGTWAYGTRSDFAWVGRALSARGVACAVIDFRKTPPHRHPAHVEDCARAFAWLVRHASELGCDKGRMFVMGHSSGGHLATLLALDERYLRAVDVAPERIRGVISISGVYDVRVPSGALTEVFGTDMRVRRAASPLYLARADAPPILLLWAEQELLGLDWMGGAMRHQLRIKQARHAWGELRERNHGTVLTTMGGPDDVTTPEVLRFLTRVQGGWPDAPAEPEQRATYVVPPHDAASAHR